VHEQEKVRSNSMSARIRSLRSKLNATEAVVQSTVDRSESVSNAAASLLITVVITGFTQ
jgi:hypothetical protein